MYIIFLSQAKREARAIDFTTQLWGPVQYNNWKQTEQLHSPSQGYRPPMRI